MVHNNAVALGLEVSNDGHLCVYNSTRKKPDNYGTRGIRMKTRISLLSSLAQCCPKLAELPTELPMRRKGVQFVRVTRWSVHLAPRYIATQWRGENCRARNWRCNETPIKNEKFCKSFKAGSVIFYFFFFLNFSFHLQGGRVHVERVLNPFASNRVQRFFSAGINEHLSVSWKVDYREGITRGLKWKYMGNGATLFTQRKRYRAERNPGRIADTVELFFALILTPIK